MKGSETRETDDASLVRAVQDGDVAAYAVLYERHEPAVRRLCTRWLHDDAAVDDVVQAAFVRAFERIDRCSGDSRFAGWVQVIAQRLCIDTARAAVRAEARAERAATAGWTTAEDPAETVMLHEQVDALQFAIATLPPRQREVVVARLVEGRRPSEIAAALGMSIAAVDSLLLRARRKLATAYGAVADERGGTNLSAASIVAVAAIVSAEPETSLRVAAAAARVAAAPFAPLTSAAPALARGLRAAAVAVAAALGGGLVGVAPARPAPPPAVAHAAPGGRPAPAPTAAPDPLDPATLTIAVPLAGTLPRVPLSPPPLPSPPPSSAPLAGPGTLQPAPAPAAGGVTAPWPDPARGIPLAVPSPGGLPLVSTLPAPLPTPSIAVPDGPAEVAAADLPAAGDGRERAGQLRSSPA